MRHFRTSWKPRNNFNPDEPTWESEIDWIIVKHLREKHDELQTATIRPSTRLTIDQDQTLIFMFDCKQKIRDHSRSKLHPRNRKYILSFKTQHQHDNTFDSISFTSNRHMRSNSTQILSRNHRDAVTYSISSSINISQFHYHRDQIAIQSTTRNVDSDRSIPKNIWVKLNPRLRLQGGFIPTITHMTEEKSNQPSISEQNSEIGIWKTLKQIAKYTRI